MADLADNVKVNVRDNVAIGCRPTLSCAIPLDQGDNLASDTGRGQTYYCLIAFFGCVLVVVVVYTFLYIISEKIKHKT